jgi:hypothetical protein
MKNVARYIAITTIVACGDASAANAPRAACAQPAAGGEFAAQSGRDLTFPNFCDIPAAPKQVRSPEVFRAAVVDTRLAGAAVARRSAPDTFSLTDTTGFIERAKREAAPPPPMTAPGESDTAAFVAKSKARAAPPPRPH